MKLKPEDIKYFEELQRDYINSINYYNAIIETMEEWIPCINTNKHLLTNTSIPHSIWEVSAEKNKMIRYFIDYIFDYLIKEYGISNLRQDIQNQIVKQYLNDNNKNKYTHKNDDLTYQQIIEDVCQVLNIKDMNQASIDNLRDRIITAHKYSWNKNLFNISDKKIKLKEWAFRLAYSYWGESSLHEDTVEEYKDILSALSYIHNKSLDIPQQYAEWLTKISNWTKEIPLEYFYSIHKVKNIDYIGIESIKFFKNRNAEVKFIDEKSKNNMIKVLKGEF